MANEEGTTQVGLKTALIFKGDSPASDNDPYIKALSDIGIKAFVIPTLSFKFVNQRVLLECLQNPGEYSSIVFTSPRSVEAVLLALQTSNEDREHLLQEWRNKIFFAVGNSTGDAAKAKLGFHCEGQESGNADALAPYITEKLSPSDQKILFPCGNLSRENLPSALISKGFEVNSIVAYETGINSCLEDNLNSLIMTEDWPKILVFFSPSGVKSVFPILEKREIAFDLLKFASIGPTTTDALVLYHNVKVWCQANKPKPESLAEAICNAVKKEL